MKTKTKLIIFGLSVFLIFRGISHFVVAETEQKATTGYIEINELETNGSFFISKIYKTNFPFTGLGLEWQDSGLGTCLTSTDNKCQIPVFYLKILNQEKWSDWLEVRQEEKDAPDFFKNKLSDIIFFPGESLQLKIISDSAALPKKIKIHYFNSPINPKLKITFSSQSELNIIPRDRWIVDEVDESTRIAVWPEDYKDIKKFIIHHTGSTLRDLNNDNIINLTDYDIAIAGVYDWHAKSLGWGDIGYNFLIDPLGRVFEGKLGGDGVVGGHAIRSASCNKFKTGVEEILGFNKGTIGIALLGNSDEEQMTLAAKQSLINLIAYKSLEFGLEPNGQSFFQDNIYPNIIGHKDIDCTKCPGQNIYSSLSEIREAAQKKFEELGGHSARIPKAIFYAQSELTAIVKEGMTKDVWVEFKNEGKTSWHNYTDESIYLAPEIVKNKLASIDSLRLALANEETPLLTYKLDKPNVRPGEVGRFTFSVNSPANQVELKKLLLAWGEKGWLPKTDVSFTIASTELDYGAVFDSILKPETIFEKNATTITLKFKNIGAQSWKQDEVALHIYNNDYKTSELAASDWPEKRGGFKPKELEIKPGEFATFTLPIKGGKTGIYKQLFTLARKITLPGLPNIVLTEEKIVGSDFTDEIKIESVYQAELVSQNVPEVAIINARPAVILKLKNTGLKTWKRGVTLLKIFDEEGKRSKFYDRSDWLNREVAAWTVEKEVKPGQVGTFKLYMRTPKATGEYGHKIVLDHNGQKIFINKKASLDLTTKVVRKK